MQTIYILSSNWEIHSSSVTSLPKPEPPQYFIVGIRCFFLVWSLFLWPNMFIMHMTKKWFSLIWPQHTIPAVLLLTLAEVQGLHFVRCPQEGLLSSNTTKAFVVMNLTLETSVFSLRTKCKCSTASSRGHIPAIISIVCSGKETSYAVFWDTGFFILIQVVRNEDKRNEDKIIYYNKWPLYFPHK